MECLLCAIWAQMPYSKRPTTPVSPQETEGVLIVGYWITSRQNTVPRICQRHMNILVGLDDQEDQRIERERVAQEAAREAAQKAVERASELPECYQQQVTEFQRRRKLVGDAMVVQPPPMRVNEPIIPFEPPVAPTPAPVAINGDFALGPGPLTNENTITPHPGLMVTETPQQPLHAQPGTIEGALEAARMPPTTGGKVAYTCHLCGKEAITGDVHACEVAEEPTG